MRLVYVVSQYPSLTETFVAREMEQLVQLGNEIIICPLRPPEKTKGPSGLTVSGAQVLRSPLTPWAWLAAQTWLLWRCPSAWRACWRDVLLGIRQVSRLHHLVYILLVTTWLARYLQNREVDHIRGHFLHSESLGCMWLSRMLGVPYSLTPHVNFIFFSRYIIEQAIKNASFVASDSQEAFDLVKQTKSRDVYIIRNGLNLRDFPFREPQPISAKGATILAIGRLKESKGFDVLIRACAELHFCGFQIQCKIIGEGKDHLLLEQMITDLKLDGIVHLLGALPFEQVRKEYSTASILAMPSKDSLTGTDGIPTVLIESMALGIPVVATRKAGIPELVKDHETGLLAEPNDDSQLANCIAALLQDRTLQKRLALAGRKLVEEEYDIHKSVAQLLELITIYGLRAGAFY